jgi:hypothetical protein
MFMFVMLYNLCRIWFHLIYECLSCLKWSKVVLDAIRKQSTFQTVRGLEIKCRGQNRCSTNVSNVLKRSRVVLYAIRITSTFQTVKGLEIQCRGRSVSRCRTVLLSMTRYCVRVHGFSRLTQCSRRFRGWQALANADCEHRAANKYAD